jgi:hypothetical protein
VLSAPHPDLWEIDMKRKSEICVVCSTKETVMRNVPAIIIVSLSALLIPCAVYSGLHNVAEQVNAALSSVQVSK